MKTHWWVLIVFVVGIAVGGMWEAMSTDEVYEVLYEECDAHIDNCINDCETWHFDLRDENTTIVNPDLCNGKSMENTAKCLNRFVKRIFQFEVMPDNRTLSFEELEKEGGDCLDWTRFYVRHIERLGFEMTVISDIEGHIFVIMYDNGGYCSLDQEHIDCFLFEEDEK